MPNLEKVTRSDALACGDKTYTGGRPCKRGHPMLRRATTGKCIACEPLDAKIWGDRNVERRQKRDRGYRLANPEKFRARDERRNRAKGISPRKPALTKTDPRAHGLKRAAQQRKRRSDNPEEVRAYAKAYRATNAERYNSRIRLDRKKNPERYRKHEQNRRNTATHRLRRMLAYTAQALEMSQLSHSRFDILDYGSDTYIKHLTNMLPVGMTITEAKVLGYQIDHIIPLSFIAKNYSSKNNHLAFCMASDLRNVRIIPRIENQKKHSSMGSVFQTEILAYLLDKYGVSDGEK